MKCDSCNEKATVFYTQVADGAVKKFALCEKCAQENGVTKPEGLLMAEELLNAATNLQGGADGDTDEEMIPVVGEMECPDCGFTLENYRKVGRLGCPQCYHTFAGEISQRLPSLHRGVRHTGYLPYGMLEAQEIRAKLGSLEKKLAKAIEKEQFEDAAALRDKIGELKSSVEGGAA